MTNAQNPTTQPINPLTWDNAPEPWTGTTWDGLGHAEDPGPMPEYPPGSWDALGAGELALVGKLESLQRMIISLGDSLQQMHQDFYELKTDLSRVEGQVQDLLAPLEYIVQDAHLWLDAEDLNVRASAGWTLVCVIEDTGNPVRYIWSRRAQGGGKV